MLTDTLNRYFSVRKKKLYTWHSQPSLTLVQREQGAYESTNERNETLA